MVHAALQLIPKDEVSRDFLVARAVAIARYAMLEYSLAQLFAHLMGVEPDVAGVIFFRINNSRARNSAIERFLKKKHGNAYNIFWNSLEKQLRILDGKRNNVVHWATSTTISVDTNPQSTVKLELIPPNFWDRTESTPAISTEDLYDFILQCDFISRLVNIFWWRLSGLGDVSAGLDIFQQPVAYPPPDTHPLCLKS
ncbi:MAG: hypothetical protein ACYDIB_09670 [Desulfobulbia bacterium]